MKKTITITGLLLITAALVGLLLFFFIRNTVKEREPEPLTNEISVSVPPSTFNIPVHIETGTIQSYLNGKIKGAFLNKKILIQKGKKEEIALTLSKRAAIQISSNGSELICTFPLTVKARLINSRLGERLAKQVKPVQTDLLITLSTPITIDQNWRISTKFRIRKIQWVTDPIVRFGPFKKNLRPSIERVIESKKSELTVMLDREIHKAASLQKTISDVWLDMQEPILISRKPAPVWIRFTCNDIHGNIALKRTGITCMTKIEAQMVVLTDTSASIAATPLPAFKHMPSNEVERNSDINLYAYTSFEEINDQLNEILKGKDITKNGYSVRITGIKTYGSAKGLSIGISTDRDLEGYVVTSGKVVFDAPTQALSVKDFDYMLDTENPLARTGDELLHSYVRDTVATKLNLSLDTLVSKVPGIVRIAISKGKAGKVIELSLDSLRIKRSDILLDSKKIHVLLNIETTADLRLKQIKPGERLFVR
ncbi:MAG: DUF4403 family protein [Chlorobium sp.]|jgi:hypothetical protein|uniref:DUF4403 family protein n=1 Tax=Chlorobium sp. TaxID=1095 RepID=UPI0025C55363|nr:DUF4403 family protein [Chlorobium sp.]MCF8216655.1 DUF4403 family protein [Chlorobium sp.]MCF8271525.1 DUF4403 family protein [Chlorobium sp.]MCF8287897.1 DUF4403 family protein [Chlorobium sp.]MCF8291471.1 DUF4403 family protein [Chlorobium sp.]MCF8385566.1 DUF4403 family protein [Chlorobium sp.]